MKTLRYPSSPEVQPQPPDRQEGNVFIFLRDMSKIGTVLFTARATDAAGNTVTALQHAFAIRLDRQRFTTLAKGTASGWAPDKDAEVRSLFTEAQVLWFDDDVRFAAFAGQLKYLLGVQVPAEPLGGRTALAVLGAPTDGVRRLEVLEMEKTPSPGAATSGWVQLNMGYASFTSVGKRF